MLYIIIAIVVFGILIAAHELGHFATAKLLKVRVNEFAIGMGPIILKKQGKNTLYSLRAFPIGGFCALEGEDEQSNDPAAFSAQPIWKKLIILVAGSFMNFLIGFIVILVIYSGAKGFVSTTLEEIADPSAVSSLQAGDKIVKIDGERIYLYSDIELFLSRGDDAYYDVVIERNGKNMHLDSLYLASHDFEYNGEAVNGYGLIFKIEKANILNKLSTAWRGSIQFVRMVRMGLSDLLSGRVGLSEMSGPVGIVSVITQVGEKAQTTAIAIENIAYLCAFIAVNLAVMNMLPIPALDGGRIFLLLVTWVIEKIIKRKVNPKIETYINAVGFVLLMVLMVVVLFNDIVKLVT